MKRPERLSRKLIRKGVILDEYADTMLAPNGQIEEYDFIDHHTGAAAVVAVKEDGQILLVRQYRNALERDTLELPCGGRESREEPMEDAARRELQEETGYTAGKFSKLIDIRTTPAYGNEEIAVFLAEDLIPGEQHLDPDESLKVVSMPLREALNLIFQCRIQDAKTVSGILACANQLQKRE
ncbi:MAG: NUDIX hydrolase [Lachnospiraceae bacterium]|nr:NUDIX hydrolase [Lachnospiraceae bacterium]